MTAEERQIRTKQREQEWRNNNRHRHIRYTRLRKLKQKQAIPKWFEAESNLVSTVYQKRDELSIKWNCKLEVDHIIPLNPKNKSVCGLHCWANLQLIEKVSNQQKSCCYQQDW